MATKTATTTKKATTKKTTTPKVTTVTETHTPTPAKKLANKKDKLIGTLTKTVQSLETKLNKMGFKTNQTIRSAEQLKEILKPTSWTFFFNLIRNGRSVREFINTIGNDTKPGI